MTAIPLPSTVLKWTGTLPDHRRDWKAVKSVLTTATAEILIPDHTSGVYRTRFLQGAFLAPRVLFFVEPTSAGPLGAGAGRTNVRSHRSNLEREPWRSLPTRTASIESEFIHPVIQGEHITPFRLLAGPSVIVPRYKNRLMAPADDDLDRFPGLAAWWRHSDELWLANRPATSRGTLLERLDYKNAMSAQYPVGPNRVVYAGSGSRMTASRLLDDTVVVEKSAYWMSCSSIAEAHYLVGVFNSRVFDEAVKPFQARGIGGARHFDKNIFNVPIPLFDPSNSTHKAIADISAQAESRLTQAPAQSSGRTRSAARIWLGANISDALDGEVAVCLGLRAAG